MKEPRTIRQYLDELGRRLQMEPLRVHRVLLEAEDHLLAAREKEITGGLSEEQAEIRAIERFGTAQDVAARFNLVSRAQIVHAAPNILMSLYQLTLIGLLVIGLSGVVSLGLATAFGKGFVAGDGQGILYSDGRCADFFSFHPEASTCQEAATAHHYDEIVQPRLGAGVLGLAGTLPLMLERRRLPGLGLPKGIFLTTCTALFGVAGAGFLFLGIGQTLTDTPGAGADLSSGLATAAVFLALAPSSLLFLIRTGGLKAS